MPELFRPNGSEEFEDLVKSISNFLFIIVTFGIIKKYLPNYWLLCDFIIFIFNRIFQGFYLKADRTCAWLYESIWEDLLTLQGGIFNLLHQHQYLNAENVSNFSDVNQELKFWKNMRSEAKEDIQTVRDDKKADSDWWYKIPVVLRFFVALVVDFLGGIILFAALSFAGNSISQYVP